MRRIQSASHALTKNRKRVKFVPMKMHQSLPTWRSLLYVPVNVPRFVERAHLRGADAMLLDLEDSIPGDQKENARVALPGVVAQVACRGSDVLVRINRPLPLAVRDIAAAVSPGVCGICITKVDSAGHVRLLEEVVADCEQRAGMSPGQTRFIALIETPSAFARMAEIAASSPRMIGLGLGAEDFALQCGFAPSEEALTMPKQSMILAARAAGIMPIGYLGSVTDLGDEDDFRRMVRRSHRFGFDAATCIHPRQVAIVNEEYGVSPADAEAARRLIAEDSRHAACGRGSFVLDGKMVDAPIVERAKRVLQRFEGSRPEAGALTEIS